MFLSAHPKSLSIPSLFKPLWHLRLFFLNPVKLLKFAFYVALLFSIASKLELRQILLALEFRHVGTFAKNSNPNAKSTLHVLSAMLLLPLIVLLFLIRLYAMRIW